MADESYFSKVKRMLAAREQDPRVEIPIGQEQPQASAPPQEISAIDRMPTGVPIDANEQTMHDQVQKATDVVNQGLHGVNIAVPRAPKGSGESNSGNVKSNADIKNFSTEAKYAQIPNEDGTPNKNPTLSDILKFERAQPEAQEQEKGQKNLENMLSMEYARPQKMNLQPLMAMADLANNGKTDQAGEYAKTYSDPSKRQEQLRNFAEKLQDDRRDRFKNMIDAAKSTKAGLDQQTLMAAITASQGLRSQDPLLGAKGSGKSIADNNGQWEKQEASAMKDIDTQTASMNHFADLAKNLNDPYNVSQLPIVLARAAIGPGQRLNLPEIKLAGVDPDSYNSLINYASKSLTGKLSDTEAKFVADHAADGLKIMKAVRDKQVEWRRGIARGQKIPQERVNNFYSPAYSDKTESMGQAAAAPASKSGEIHPEDAKPGDVVMGHKRLPTGKWNSPEGWEK